jgi:hypothetical protein
VALKSSILSGVGGKRNGPEVRRIKIVGHVSLADRSFISRPLERRHNDVVRSN